MAIRSLQPDTAMEIVRLFKTGLGHLRIAQQLEVSEDAVRDLLRGKTYTEFSGGRLLFGRRDGKGVQCLAKRGNEN